MGAGGSPIRGVSQHPPGVAAGRRLGESGSCGGCGQRLLPARHRPAPGNFPTSVGGAPQAGCSPRAGDRSGPWRRGRGGARRAGAGLYPPATAGGGWLSPCYGAGSHSGGRGQVTGGSGRGERRGGDAGCGGRAGGRARRFRAQQQCAEGGPRGQGPGDGVARRGLERRREQEPELGSPSMRRGPSLDFGKHLKATRRDGKSKARGDTRGWSPATGMGAGV